MPSQRGPPPPPPERAARNRARSAGTPKRSTSASAICPVGIRNENRTSCERDTSVGKSAASDSEIKIMITPGGGSSTILSRLFAASARIASASSTMKILRGPS